MREIVQGEREIFVIQLGQKDSGGVVRPFDLTGNTEISVCWKAESTIVQKNRVAATIGVIVVGADTDGKIQGTLEVADTDSFPQTSNGSIEIIVTKAGGDVTKWQIDNAFQVLTKICP